MLYKYIPSLYNRISKLWLSILADTVMFRVVPMLAFRDLRYHPIEMPLYLLGCYWVYTSITAFKPVFWLAWYIDSLRYSL